MIASTAADDLKQLQLPYDPARLGLPAQYQQTGRPGGRMVWLGNSPPVSLLAFPVSRRHLRFIGVFELFPNDAADCCLSFLVGVAMVFILGADRTGDDLMTMGYV